jgi:hypothetical protein
LPFLPQFIVLQRWLTGPADAQNSDFDFSDREDSPIRAALARAEQRFFQRDAAISIFQSGGIRVRTLGKSCE